MRPWLRRELTRVNCPARVRFESFGAVPVERQHSDGTAGRAGTRPDPNDRREAAYPSCVALDLGADEPRFGNWTQDAVRWSSSTGTRSDPSAVYVA